MGEARAAGVAQMQQMAGLARDNSRSVVSGEAGIHSCRLHRSNMDSRFRGSDGCEARANFRREKRANYLARALSAATAGNSLPSRNSRNAPPPVEI